MAKAPTPRTHGHGPTGGNPVPAPAVDVPASENHGVQSAAFAIGPARCEHPLTGAVLSRDWVSPPASPNERLQREVQHAAASRFHHSDFRGIYHCAGRKMACPNFA